MQLIIINQSRREWMLDLFEKNGKRMKSNFRFQFWQYENHPVLLGNKEMYQQRITYLHENPEEQDLSLNHRTGNIVVQLITILRMQKVYGDSAIRLMPTIFVIEATV